MSWQLLLIANSHNFQAVMAVKFDISMLERKWKNDSTLSTQSGYMQLTCSKTIEGHLEIHRSIDKKFLDYRLQFWSKKYLCEFKMKGLNFHVPHMGISDALISISSAAAPRKTVNPTPILCPPQNCPRAFTSNLIWEWRRQNTFYLFCWKCFFDMAWQMALPEPRKNLQGKAFWPPEVLFLSFFRMFWIFSHWYGCMAWATGK